MRRSLPWTVLFALAPMAGAAQVTATMDVGGGVGRASNGVWARESRVAPLVQLTRPYGFLQTHGIFLERAGRLHLERAAYGGGVVSPVLGVFRFSLAAATEMDSVAPSMVLDHPDVTAAMSVKRGASGAWLGSSVRSGRAPALVVGMWRSLGSAVVSIYSTRHSAGTQALLYQNREVAGWDTIPSDSGPITRPVVHTVTDTVRRSQLSSWAGVEARADWSRGRITISALVAGRGPMDSLTGQQMWGRITTAVRVANGVWLSSAAGTMPSPISPSGARPRRYMSIGVRLAPHAGARQPLPVAIRPSATGFTVEALSEDEFRISVRAPNARMVEVAGDFSAWTAVPLREATPGQWEASVRMTAGTHRMSVRVNGDRWTAPPGVPSVQDEFMGHVGVVVVK